MYQRASLALSPPSPPWSEEQNRPPGYGRHAGMDAGGLAFGSAEARRLASPVSGLRCSGTLIVHIPGTYYPYFGRAVSRVWIDM
jgi:hypothetical protein